MTKDQLHSALAVLVTTLAETDGAPSGYLYMALQSMDAEVYTLQNYQGILRVLTGSRWATVDRDYVTITDEGRAMADRVNAAMGA